MSKQNLGGDGSTKEKLFRGFRIRGGYDATQETALLKNQRRDRPDQRDQKLQFQDFWDRMGDDVTF